MPREHERTQYFTEVSLESASGKRQARISDVSLGGCFVDTLTNVSEGEDVHLSSTLESGDRLDIKGKVAYVMNGFGFGVEFIDLDSVSEATLKKIVENS
jgi:Tfp pilus assembly protein PilZ